MTSSDLTRLIVGSPRSGSTLLSVLLNACPNTASFSESRIIDHHIRFIAGSIICDKKLCLFMHKNGLSWQELARGTLKAGIDTLLLAAQRNKCSSFVEKSCYLHDYLCLLDDLIPDTLRIVFIVRHPYDCVSSMLHNMQVVPSDIEGTDVERATKFLCGQMDLLLEFYTMRPEICLMVKYESLLDDPDREVSRVANFLKIDPPVTRLREWIKTAKVEYTGGDRSLFYGRRLIDNVSLKRWQQDPPEIVEMYTAELLRVKNSLFY